MNTAREATGGRTGGHKRKSTKKNDTSNPAKSQRVNDSLPQHSGADPTSGSRANWLENVDCMAVYEREVQLHNAGNGRFRGLCPFHADKNPSFYIFRDKKFYCFGCQERGDVIAFVQKLHGFSFPEALCFLGIERGEITPELWAEIKKQRQKAELVKAFRSWEKSYADKLATQIRATRKVMASGLLTPESLDDFAAAIQKLSIDEYHFFDILCASDDFAKFQLFKEKGAHDDI